MKSKVIAAVLAFFLGGLGAHKFYLGKTWLGVLYLVFCWTYIPTVVAFIEFILFLTMSQDEFDRKYNNGGRTYYNNFQNQPTPPPIPPSIPPPFSSNPNMDNNIVNICTRCKNQVDSDSVFCTHCGHKL